ncbi:hypothetical protein K432DRAFT_401294 [Lepidopterella palustris CBS 459.81]|uniref:Elongation of fatty acids protein n=1 Tax=Lepidopterella palustris CBS 459.81 TaxID=1314670 RepID=A0A8E2EHW7_9PEZI|nr:hypothetical protein K432DRAFT_401294 [Lepidopterella palustris CBS 459.81]
MSGPSIRLSLPSWSLIKFPPDWAPPTLPPPADEHTVKSPFTIPADIYNNLLSPAYPITIAAVYAITVSYVNTYNRKAGNKAWYISKTRAFRAFVVAHNVFLAIYSGVTFAAMVRALGVALPSLDNEYGLVGTVDSLCKMHGPRGLGNAATFNATANIWEVKNKLINLGENGTPNPTDVGRIWNEGLAFWGWFFYLSKFYEVFDTFIILAKGKRSSTLQTYHHAGAMMCMWAGMRFMSPPVWMFALVNSGIHTVMYTYYTISALRIRVPQTVKRTITTMQIAQMIVGTSFAAIHLFVSYTIPVSTPYTVLSTISSAASSISSAASSAIEAGGVASATANVGALIKKLAYRAAGEEGLAENVRSSQGQIFGAEAERLPGTIKETRYRIEYQEVPCIDTTGQSFAILLNIMYLLPLTALFVRFFVHSYIRRTSASSKHPTHYHALSKAGKDAVHGVDREIESLGKAAENGIAILTDKVKRGVDNKHVQEQVDKVAQANGASKEASQQSKNTYVQNNDAMQAFNDKVAKSLEEVNVNGDAAVEKARMVAADLVAQGKEVPEQLQKRLENALKQAQEDTHGAKKEAEDKAKEIKMESVDAKDGVKAEGENDGELVKANGKSTSTKDEKTNGELVKKEEGDGEELDEEKLNGHPNGNGFSTTDPKEQDES